MQGLDKYTALFAPIQQRSKLLPSRVVLAPINTGYARNGVPTDRLVRFHRDRSSPTIGINFVGNVATSSDGRTNPNTAVLATAVDIPPFAKIAGAIREGGSLPGLQLADTSPLLRADRRWKAKNSIIELERLRSLAVSVSAAEISRLLDGFIASAGFAQDAGYDVVQVHAAHGYTLSLLLNPLINMRMDEYGSSSDWFLDFIAGMRSRLTGALLSVRLSLFTQAASREYEVEASGQLAQRLERLGVDIIDFSAGFYTLNRFLIYPLLSEGTLPLLEIARPIISKLHSMVMLSGNLVDLRTLQVDLPPRLLVGVGRALIADPGFARKTAAQLHGEITRCRRCNHCHYFTRGRPSLECGVNNNL